MAKKDEIYCRELADEICRRIAGGEALMTICMDKDMPARSSVYEWLKMDKDFADRYAESRTIQADAMDDEILECARACTPETANADRVKLDAFKWRAMKLNPKAYGERTDVVVSGTISITAALEAARARISNGDGYGESKMIDVTPEEER